MLNMLITFLVAIQLQVKGRVSQSAGRPGEQRSQSRRQRPVRPAQRLTEHRARLPGDEGGASTPPSSFKQLSGVSCFVRGRTILFQTRSRARSHVRLNSSYSSACFIRLELGWRASMNGTACQTRKPSPSSTPSSRSRSLLPCAKVHPHTRTEGESSPHGRVACVDIASALPPAASDTGLPIRFDEPVVPGCRGQSTPCMRNWRLGPVSER
jgi:hypothetical protein